MVNNDFHNSEYRQVEHFNKNLTFNKYQICVWRSQKRRMRDWFQIDFFVTRDLKLMN